MAFENSKQELWPLMGYALKERLADLERLHAKAQLRTMPIYDEPNQQP